MCAHHSVDRVLHLKAFLLVLVFFCFVSVVLCFFILFSFGGVFLCFVVVGFGWLRFLLLFGCCFCCRPRSSSDRIKEIVANLAGPYTTT